VREREKEGEGEREGEYLGHLELIGLVGGQVGSTAT
jgi:hypothetical protein